ncbi:response regulator receiver domain protein (macronuclear) [Tetrahymena thermophila SB210]|uniref:Response regulator receiver domain protein n=1 Tax=Tetrahymena thermophila (strain SB210) TaxID=312017 RepID=Q23PS1_TETTS|nr:response regulator receiver domain protein [Tetrahymena thermophila SB210]EAR98614.2 response regulator receiver domain protein [Tetrahymena thermophila SB210]|eukprot:XP_001018859.2 response regulator receiver domain protein [Tetrahymena thermophila SB210]
MASRIKSSKNNHNNIDKQYNMSMLLQFQQEQVEKRYSLEYLHRHKYSFIAIILFNTFHVIYGFLTATSLTQVLYPVLSWFMILSLLFCVGIMYMHNQYFKKNFIFQILIRLSSLYFYCSQYLCIDLIETGKNATYFASSALGISIHMIFTNMLTIPHWKVHLIYNFTSFTLVQVIVSLYDNDASLRLNLTFFILAQAGMHVFAGFFEKFIREFWIHLDVSKKLSNQFQLLIDELPQPLMIIDSNLDVHLCNSGAQSFFQTILPANQLEGNFKSANNICKLIHRLNPPDIKIIENLVNQVKENDKLCTVNFQKNLVAQAEQAEQKFLDLIFLGSSIQWKTQKCVLLQIQQAEKLIEKEIEKNTITIEKVYEIEIPQKVSSSNNIQNAEIEESKNQGQATGKTVQNLTESEVTSIQFMPIQHSKPARNLTFVENVYSLSIGDDERDKSQKKSKNKMTSPDQSPINFVSPQDKIIDESTLYSTHDNSEGEVNINVDDEITKHFSFIESGLSNLLMNIITKIQNIKGKKINLSFGSLENSPNTRQQSVGSSNLSFVGNKIFNTISSSLSGGPMHFYKEPNSPDKSKKQETQRVRKIIAMLNESDGIHLAQGTSVLGENQKVNATSIGGEDEIVIESDTEDNAQIQKSGEIENKLASVQQIKIEYKYNDVCTIIFFDESQNGRMNIPYAKYELPIKFHTFSDGQKALSFYLESMRSNTLFHFVVLGIEASKGISGLEVMNQIRSYEKENQVPRTFLIASFNTVGDEVGGQTKSAETYLFKGFDKAFEKPLTRDIINDLIKERQNPQVTYALPEDYDQKYSYLDKFTILICDDVIQTSMMVKDFVSQNNVEVEIAKSEKSFINSYLQQIESGKLYQIVMIAINSNQMSGIEIVKKIREYEAEKKAKKTYIVGMFKQLNETIANGQKQNSPEKYKDDGFDEVIIKPLERNQVIQLVERIKKEIVENGDDISVKGSVNSSMMKSPPLKQRPSSSQISIEKIPSISQIVQSDKMKKRQLTLEELEELELNGPSILTKAKQAGIKIGGDSSQTELGSQQNVAQQQPPVQQQNEKQKVPNIDNQFLKSQLNPQQKQFFNKQPAFNKQQEQNMDDLELKQAFKVFNKVKQQGIQIETDKSENNTPAFKDQQKPAQNSFNQDKSKLLEDQELKALNNMFSKVHQKGIKIEGEKPQQSVSFSNAQPQQTSLSKIPEIDEFDIFKKIKDKGIKFGGDSQSSETSQTQSQDNKNELQSLKTNLQGTERQSNKSSPGQSVSNNSSKINKFEMSEKFAKFDQIRQKSQQKEDNSAQVKQTNPQSSNQVPQQRQSISNNSSLISEVQKAVVNKSEVVKTSLQKSQSQLKTSPIQSFKGQPNQQVQINQVMKQPDMPEYKYNEKPTFIVMEDSFFSLMSISQMKSDIPKVVESTTTGEATIEKYMNSIKKNILYNFMIIGMNTNKGLNGYEVLKTIREYEKENNVPRTYLIASFNAVGSQIGGMTNTKETFTFKGFDDAIEKPIKATDMNSILQSRANPQIIYQPKEVKVIYRFYDTFTILVCDDQENISVSLTTSSLNKTYNEYFDYCWNGQSLFDKYMSSIESGRIYQVILTQIKPLIVIKKNQPVKPDPSKKAQPAKEEDDKDQAIQEDAIQKIRTYEKENKIPQTYIIGFMRINSKNQSTVQELKAQGYNDVIDLQIGEEDLYKLITKLKLTLKLQA